MGMTPDKKERLVEQQDRFEEMNDDQYWQKVLKEKERLEKERIPFEPDAARG